MDLLSDLVVIGNLSVVHGTHLFDEEKIEPQ
jgi:hypothetical protein